MNRESYNAIATEWDQVRVSLSPAEQRIFDMLLEGMPPGSHVLDLGCGTGRPVAEYLVSRQMLICGVDQSTEMLKIAQARMPEQQWVEQKLEDYNPQQRFAAAVAWDSLFHIPRELHAGIFESVRSVLPVGGKFALTVGGSEHAPFTDMMFNQEFFYDSHPPQGALEILQDSGFETFHSEYLNLPTDGRDKGRFAIVVCAQL